MKPSLKLIGTKKVTGNMARLQKKVPSASYQSMARACELLRGYIVSKKLSGQLLKVRTNRLRGGIVKEVEQRGNITIGKVGSNVKYARIHELGGVIKPVRAKYLAFVVDGHFVMAKEVKMPARHYIGSSMREAREMLQKAIGKKFWTEVTSG